MGHILSKTAFILIILVLAACAPLDVPAASSTEAPTATTLVQVRLPVGYIPNVQFAPLYVAIDKGYFTQNGIDLSLDYSTEINGVSLVGANQLQFAIASGDQVLPARAQGLPVVYVMAWYQEYPVGIAFKSAEKILKPADLKGKKIGIPMLSGASYIGLRALLSAGGLTEQDVTLDVIGFNQVEALATDREQAIVVYVPNEPTILKSEGYSINVLRAADYIKLISNGLITNETTIANNPDLVKHMVAAILHGIQDTLANPAEAYQISMKYVPNLTANDQVQKDVLTATLPFWQASRPGYSDPQGWKNMQDVLLNMGILTQSIDLSQAYTNEFVP